MELYPWASIRACHAIFLQQIELGHSSWASEAERQRQRHSHIWNVVNATMAKLLSHLSGSRGKFRKLSPAPRHVPASTTSHATSRRSIHQPSHLPLLVACLRKTEHVSMLNVCVIARSMMHTFKLKMGVGGRFKIKLGPCSHPMQPMGWAPPTRDGPLAFIADNENPDIKLSLSFILPPSIVTQPTGWLLSTHHLPPTTFSVNQSFPTQHRLCVCPHPQAPPNTLSSPYIVQPLYIAPQ